MDKAEKHLTFLVKDLIRGSQGRITYAFIDKELDITTPAEKSLRRGVLKEMVDAGEVRRESRVAGVFWLIDDEAPEENWQFADKKVVLLRFPFQLEEYIRVLPKSLIIVAGAPGAGKTTLLYNVANLNMYDFDIHLFNSEMGLSQIQEKLDAINPDIPNPAPFHIRHREDNFADVIEPDAINLIDYLDMDSEVYMIGAELKRILFKLNEGVAIVAIQKPIGRDLGYGAGYSLKSASLYLSMDSHKLKIVKARERADNSVNPINKTWSFKIDNRGAKFTDIKEWQGS